MCLISIKNILVGVNLLIWISDEKTYVTEVIRIPLALARIFFIFFFTMQESTLGDSELYPCHKKRIEK